MPTNFVVKQVTSNILSETPVTMEGNTPDIPDIPGPTDDQIYIETGYFESGYVTE